MKIITKLLILIIFWYPSMAQNSAEVVSWSSRAEHVKGDTWRLIFTAKMADKWHIYSQTQNSNAISLPTNIIFNKNSSYKLIGECYERGDLKYTQDSSIGISAKYYEDSVEFRQTVKVFLPEPYQTEVQAMIDFQVCTNDKCLPPARRYFKVKLCK